MQRIRFIINPISGVGRQRLIEQAVETHLDTTRFAAELVYTEAAGHAVELARVASEEGVDVVVAVGGDGSVNEVSQGLEGRDTAMAIIPTGSGNGLARHLQIPLDLARAIQKINAGTIEPIDTVTLNGTVFVGLAGVGFDALIAKEFDTFGQRGFLSYMRLILREVMQYTPRTYRINIDGQELEREAFLITIANASQYGYGAQIAPKASLKDGLIELCIVKPMPAVLLPEMVVRMFRGTIHKTRFVELLQGRNIVIEQEGTLAHLHGEPLEAGQKLQFEIRPLSLNVLV